MLFPLLCVTRLVCESASVCACEHGCGYTWTKDLHPIHECRSSRSRAYLSVCSVLRVVLKSLYHLAAGSTHLEIKVGLQWAPSSRDSPSIHRSDSMQRWRGRMKGKNAPKCRDFFGEREHWNHGSLRHIKRGSWWTPHYLCGHKRQLHFHIPFLALPCLGETYPFRSTVYEQIRMEDAGHDFVKHIVEKQWPQKSK